jgi:hypothetical protein
MKNLNIFFFFLFIVCCAGCSSNQNSGDDIYLNNVQGNDRNNGDIKHPLKSISRLNELLKQKTLNVFFAGGQVFDGTVIVRNLAGSVSDSIRIGSYGSGNAVINGGKAEALKVEKCNYLIISNLDLSGDGRKNGNITNGLSLAGSSNCTVRNLNAYGFQISGVNLYNCRKIKVRNVSAHDNGFCGINITGSSRDSSGCILVKDCKAENNPGDPAILNNHSGNGILAGVSDSVTIDHCTATNNGWDMPRQGNGPVGIWTWESDHVTIQYCISYRNKTSKGGSDGGGFDLDGGVRNSLVQYCLSYENQGAGFGLFQYLGASSWSDNTIRYCISINDATTTSGSGSFFIWNGSHDKSQFRDCYVYNNVAYNTSTPVMSFESSSDHENFIFSNNIFLGSEKMISGKNTGSMFLGNVWWSEKGKLRFFGYNSLSDWIRTTGQEKLNGIIVGIQTDPKLYGPFLTEITDPYKLNSLEGFMLRPDSPVKNKGVDIKSAFGIMLPEHDFYGNAVPSGPAPEPGICELK